MKALSDLRAFSQNDIFGFVESVKTASNLFLPVGGEVVAVNEALDGTPDVINSDPYGQGWMIRIRCEDLSQLSALLGAADYRRTLDG